MMQARAVVEENGSYMSIPRSHHSNSNLNMSKREWPQKLLKFLSFFMLLGSGIIVGVIVCSHMTRFIDKDSMFYLGSVSCRDGLQARKNDEDAKYLSSEELINLPLRLENWIKPPLLMHNMSDQDLFWRASLVPSRTEEPFKIVPKIAFLFLTRGPLPLAPLWEKFFHGHEGLFSIYVHTLPNYQLQVPADSVFYRRQIPNKLVEWGRISMCDAERRLLANALLDYANTRFVLLSEACIPVYNFSTVYQYLLSSKHSFMSVFDDKGPNGRGRYNPRMQPEVTLGQWRKGSQWFEVSRQLAVKIIADTHYYPIFKKYCTPACYVDEHYFPTMLSIHHGSLLANRSLTWVDWSRGGPHPAMFGGQDISEDFIAKIRNGSNCTYNDQFTSICFLFARKFAPSALKPLLKLSSKIMRFG
eukprot:TRINITY_DN2999_c0_g1_i1.p1 TRINITY_DN2999_c0_g1~~TRINITY_DN2999_c0_g1_i1.p1  ORF type:complete len:415 (-),score=42.73 TRINITY_DN2999_c0_g1_i1:422-1666(-)